MLLCPVCHEPLVDDERGAVCAGGHRFDRAREGYLYLLRSTANHDIDDPAAPELSEYYSEKGETPGRWVGSGLVGLRESGGSIEAGHRVTEAHMQALFGERLTRSFRHE